VNELPIGLEQAGVASSAGNDGKGARNRIAFVGNYVPRRCGNPRAGRTLDGKDAIPLPGDGALLGDAAGWSSAA